MPSSDGCEGLRLYWNHLKGHTTPFRCPHCQHPVLSVCFENHCSKHHRFDSKRACVWCSGNTSWPCKQKRLHVDHLLSCWRRFTRKPSPPPPSPPPVRDEPVPKPAPVPFDHTPMAPKRCLFDHAFDPPPRAFDLVWPLGLDPNPLAFEDEALDKAVACVRKYLALGDTHEWFHVMVRTLAYPEFLRAMDADEGRTRTLPFSCWCDGGQPEEPRYRQHRHLIVVSPAGHFLRRVWGTVRPEERPRKNFRCLHSEPVASAMHLVNAIGYLCKRESRCNFSGDRKHAPEKQNHFHLAESLPRGYRLPLVLQWEGGLRQLLDQEFRNMKRGVLVRADVQWFQCRWQFRIKDIPGIALGTVLPVQRPFRPCPRPTDRFVHLTKGRKLYFERDPSLDRLSREAWLDHQADMGNLFYFVVGEDAWIPRPYHQVFLNEFKPLVDRERDLVAEASRWKRKYEASEQEATRWKRKYEASEQENQRPAET